MPHTECAHRQAQTQISNESPPSSCSALRLIGPTGRFFVKSKALHKQRGLHMRCSLYRHLPPFPERVSTTHHNLYPQFGVQSRNVNSSTFCLSLSLRGPLSVTAGLCLRGTCTRRWTPPFSAGPISHSQSKCKCPVGAAEWTERTIISALKTDQYNILAA